MHPGMTTYWQQLLDDADSDTGVEPRKPYQVDE